MAFSWCFNLTHYQVISSNVFTQVQEYVLVTVSLEYTGTKLDPRKENQASQSKASRSCVLSCLCERNLMVPAMVLGEQKYLNVCTLYKQDEFNSAYVTTNC